MNTITMILLATFSVFGVAIMIKEKILPRPAIIVLVALLGVGLYQIGVGS